MFYKPPPKIVRPFHNLARHKSNGRGRDSNPRPPGCKPGALAAELSARAATAARRRRRRMRTVRLHRVRAAAAAGRLGVGVLDAEAAAVDVVVEIDRDAVEVHQAAAVDDDRTPWISKACRRAWVDVRVEVELVLEAAAAAADHAQDADTPFRGSRRPRCRASGLIRAGDARFLGGARRRRAPGPWRRRVPGRFRGAPGGVRCSGFETAACPSLVRMSLSERRAWRRVRSGSANGRSGVEGIERFHILEARSVRRFQALAGDDVLHFLRGLFRQDDGRGLGQRSAGATGRVPGFPAAMVDMRFSLVGMVLTSWSMSPVAVGSGLGS